MTYVEFVKICESVNIKERVGEWDFIMVQRNAKVKDFDKEVGKCLAFVSLFKQDYLGAGSFKTWMNCDIDL